MNDDGGGIYEGMVMMVMKEMDLGERGGIKESASGVIWGSCFMQATAESYALGDYRGVGVAYGRRWRLDDQPISDDDWA